MNDDILEDKESNSNEERPDFNSVLHADDDMSSARPRGISRPSAVLLFILASMLGGAIGWLGPNFMSGDKPTAVSMERFDALTARLDAQEITINSVQNAQTKQAARFKSLTRSQKNLSSKLAIITDDFDKLATGATQDAVQNGTIDAPQDSAANVADTAQEGFIDIAPDTQKNADPDTPDAPDASLETSSDITAITQRLDKLEAGQMLAQTEAGTGIADISALTERLAIIDTQQTEIESLASSANELGARVGALEDDVALIAETAKEQTAQAALTSQSDTMLTALISSFPRAALEEAASTQTQAKKQGLVARGLSRHVKVIDRKDPLLTIAAAERTLKAGDIAGAIATLETLDPAISVSAQDWIETARRAQPK